MKEIKELYSLYTDGITEGTEKIKKIVAVDGFESIDRLVKEKCEYEKKVKYYQSQLQELKEVKYKDLFYYFDGLVGTAISQSMHPAGIIVSPVTLPDNYGAFWSR